jgi:beta-xylosidase
MYALKLSFLLLFCHFSAMLCAQDSVVHGDGKKSGNPVFPGWYADPEGALFEGKYWIYPTWSDKYAKQTFFDAFSSTDLVTWVKHPHVLDTSRVKWARYAMWAPSVIAANGRYYFFFAANDIQNDQEYGGIGVAVSNKPDGPFTDLPGQPVIKDFHNGAQPIDQFAFRDDDGSVYLYYGGWRHCNVVKLDSGLQHVIPYPNGETYREITPDNYVEGPFVIKRNNVYYLMWSEGGWQGPDYCVAYAMGLTPFGPFKRIGKILEQNPKSATGAGHHSVIHIPGSDEWYIVYHRRPLNTTDGNHRETCIDRMYFDTRGFILPVVMTNEGVARRPLTK